MDFIEVYPNALPDDLCDRLILAFDQHTGVVDGQTGNGVDPEKKISRDLTLDNFDDMQPLKNELLSYTLKGVVDYFTQYSMALMGAVAVSVSDAEGKPTTLTPSNFAQLGLPKVDGLVKYLYRSGSINIQKYQRNKGGYPHWHSEQFPQSGHNEPYTVLCFICFILMMLRRGEKRSFTTNDVKLVLKKALWL